MPKCKRRKLKKIFTTVIAVFLLSAVIWNIIRHSTSVECTQWTGTSDNPYSEEENVFISMSLSYLAYGCETCEKLCGTVSDILDTAYSGITIDTSDILYGTASDPSTALIDSDGFMERTVGRFRFMTELNDTESSFYGAAFADDDRNAVWIAYSGAVSFMDILQSTYLVFGAGLSGQEKCAFALYEDVLRSEEIMNGYYLILTGHSLGGALAAIVSYVSGCEAVTVSGADGLALNKISDIAGSRENYRITNYLTTPDNGRLVPKDLVQRIMFLGMRGNVTYHVYPDNGLADSAHSVFGFVCFRDDARTEPFLPDEITDNDS